MVMPATRAYTDPCATMRCTARHCVFSSASVSAAVRLASTPCESVANDGREASRNLLRAKARHDLPSSPAGRPLSP